MPKPKADPVAELKKLGATIKPIPGPPPRGVMVQLSGTHITDARLVHLKGLTNLKTTNLSTSSNGT